MKRLRVHLRLTVCAVVACLQLSTPSAASAQPTDEHVLVVGVTRGRGNDARLARGLAEHIQQSGRLLSEGPMSAEDRACESQDCFQTLADRQHAQLVIMAKILESAPSTYFVRMALFDAVRRAPFEQTATCDQCDHDALIGKLSDLADQIIKECQQARLQPLYPAPPASASSVPSAPALSLLPEAPSSRTLGPGVGSQAPAGFSARLTPTQKLVAGLFGGLAGAAFITAIALHATHDQPTALSCTMSRPDLGLPCQLNNRSAFAAFYAVGGALTIGMGFTLLWPGNSKKAATREGH